MSVEILTKSLDNKINSLNFLVKMDTNDFIKISKKIIDNNEYQRKRVKSSSSVYSLLKSDLREGCLIPPIVLAISKEQIESTDDNEIIRTLKDNDKILILDGLQRTYTILELDKELKSKKEEEDKFYNQTIRIELYVDITRIGVLYRMLTLNTGQTPMSLRHQIEILYQDLDKIGTEGILILKEKDERKPRAIGEYRFVDMIEGIHAYIISSPLPLTRYDVLETVKSIESLTKENKETKIFEIFIDVFNTFMLKLNEVFEDWDFDNKKDNNDTLYKIEIPFGKNIIKIFNRGQSISGFGAAIARLKKFELINSFDELKDMIDRIEINENDNNDFLPKILSNLDEIQRTAKKIGNDQRLYFSYFFRELFNPQSEVYGKLYEAAAEAFFKYSSQVI